LIYIYSLESLLSECEPARHEEPRSILQPDNTVWSPSTDPFFREDELHEVHQVLTEFFSESHTPSYIIDSQDTVVDPQDGAIAGPSGLCRGRLQKESGSTSDKNPAVHNDSEVPNQMSCNNEEEQVSNVSSSLIIICLILNLMENIHLVMVMLLIIMLMFMTLW